LGEASLVHAVEEQLVNRVAIGIVRVHVLGPYQVFNVDPRGASRVLLQHNVVPREELPVQLDVGQLLDGEEVVELRFDWEEFLPGEDKAEMPLLSLCWSEIEKKERITFLVLLEKKNFSFGFFNYV
jgi:hypothetical protein